MKPWGSWTSIIWLLATFSIIQTIAKDDCVPVYKVVQEQFFKHNDFLRRGFSNKFVSTIYCSFTDALTKRVVNKYRENQPFGSVCLDATDKQILLNFLEKKQKKFLKETKKMHMFYLPHDKYPHLQNMSRRQQDEVIQVWNEVVSAMAVRPEWIDISAVCKLPNGLQLFFDPGEKKTKKRFSRLTESEQDLITAPSLLYEVLAIVVRLKILNIPDSESKPILAHCAAYLFTAIRANRREDYELFVSNAYVVAYHAVFANLTQSISPLSVPPIDPAIIEDRMGKNTRQLLKFNSWGRLEEIDEGDVGLVKHSLWDRIITTPQIEQIKSDMQLNGFGRLVGIARKPLTVQKSIRTSSECESEPGYWHYAAGGLTPRSQCCAKICKSIDESVHMPGVTILDCCKGCNMENRCEYATENISVRTAKEIYVESYGDYQAITLTI